MKRRVLHIINSFEIGGAEMLLKDIIMNYQDDASELWCAYLIGNGTILRGFELHHPVIDLSDNGKFSWRSVFRLMSVIRGHRIDVIHTHDPQSGIMARIAGYLTGVRRIVTTRHTTHLHGRHRLLYWIENVLLRWNSVVIAVSDAVRDVLIRDYGISSEKVLVISNGIALDRYAGPRGQGPRKGFTVGCVARLHPAKGVDILIDAADRLRSHRDIHFAIAGEGSQRMELEEKIRSFEIRSSVELLGALSPVQVPPFMRSLDLFVLPSRQEGLSIALIEAMASGTPVVVSDVVGNKQVIQHEVNGLLFRSEDPDSLCEQILRYYHSIPLRESLARSAEHHVSVHYNITQYIDRLRSLYLQLA